MMPTHNVPRRSKSSVAPSTESPAELEHTNRSRWRHPARCSLSSKLSFGQFCKASLTGLLLWTGGAAAALQSPTRRLAQGDRTDGPAALPFSCSGLLWDVPKDELGMRCGLRLIGRARRQAISLADRQLAALPSHSAAAVQRMAADAKVHVEQCAQKSRQALLEVQRRIDVDPLLRQTFQTWPDFIDQRAVEWASWEDEGQAAAAAGDAEAVFTARVEQQDDSVAALIGLVRHTNLRRQGRDGAFDPQAPLSCGAEGQCDALAMQSVDACAALEGALFELREGMTLLHNIVAPRVLTAEQAARLFTETSVDLAQAVDVIASLQDVMFFLEQAQRRTSQASQALGTVNPVSVQWAYVLDHAEELADNHANLINRRIWQGALFEARRDRRRPQAE